MASIPLVDFGQYLHGSEEEKIAAATAIDSAFRNVGFVYLTNHGVPQDAVDECFEWVFDPHIVPPEAIYISHNYLRARSSSIYHCQPKISLHILLEAHIIAVTLVWAWRKSRRMSMTPR